MIKSNDNTEVLLPKNQLELYGYEFYFHSILDLFEKKKLPNSIIINGPKGLGKSTFVYHIINYFLSKNETEKYSIDNFTINPNNKSYKLLNENTHPNFFLIENVSTDKEIKIDQIRNLLNFLNKSVYSANLKIVMIDNAEQLNKNSSNALLKAIEEPGLNTFFFLVYNNSSKILNTIKSRCAEFKIFFTTEQKINIFKNIINLYDGESGVESFFEYLYFDTPGNLIKYFLILQNSEITFNDNKLSCIFHLIEKFTIDKNPDTLNFLSTCIEKFYNDLSKNNINKIGNYSFNQSKILKQIHDMKKYNLNEKNILFSIKDTLKNEAR